MILSKPDHIKIYGHRGARGNFPENTLGSFQYLFNNSINAYETDILISKDLIPVITHDFRLGPNVTKDSNGHWLKKDDIILEIDGNEVHKFPKRALYVYYVIESV